jgi:ribosomal protein S18 acetylase RimI-like enzyme
MAHMRIQRHAVVERFLARAEGWLMQAEVENSLTLAVARQWRPAVSRPPAYWATVEHGDAIVGCAFRTPPYQTALSTMPLDAIPVLIDDLGALYEDLPGVGGPPEEAERFAQIWGQRYGVGWRVHVHQRLHVLYEVKVTCSLATGALRRASAADLDTGTVWLQDFSREAGLSAVGDNLIERLINAGRLYFWEDEGPRSMLAATRDTPNGSCISAVYTPPPFRGRGYATSAVASLSGDLLASGRRFCFLYTDVANATSNAIYRRIGFAPIEERIEIDFLARELQGPLQQTRVEEDS